MKSRFLIEQRLDEMSKEARRFDVRKFDQLSQKKQTGLRAGRPRRPARGPQESNRNEQLASPAEWGMAGRNPGDIDNGFSFKGFGPGMKNRIRPPSMYEMDGAQVAAVKQAAQQNMPLKVAIGSKGIEHGYFGGQLRDKAAITEGGLNNPPLPPIQQFGPNGWFRLPYELTRVQNYLPNVAMDGPDVAYFRHDSNGAEAAYVGEGQTKPDISPVISDQYVRRAKVAGRFLATHKLIQDAGDAFGQHIVTDLARICITLATACYLVERRALTDSPALTT